MAIKEVTSNLAALQPVGAGQPLLEIDPLDTVQPARNTGSPLLALSYGAMALGPTACATPARVVPTKEKNPQIFKC